MTEPTCTRTILLVEDDEDIRETLKDFLEDNGFDVRVAADGGEALGILDGIEPCLLVVDLVMPGMDGWELLRRLERAGLTSRIPIYVSTSAPGAAPPGFPVLPKPVDVLRILDVVRAHCA